MISTTFCLIVVRSPNLVYSAQDFTSLTTLLDFELVMMSVVPYSYFKRFVNRNGTSQFNREPFKSNEEGEVASVVEARSTQIMYPIYLKLYTSIELL